ncbi:MAG TPA: long-chain fatty acid--CoA ligase [Bryobacteraceae bacterium]
MPARTVFTVLEETARQYGDALALYQPNGSKAGRGYRTYSWNEWLGVSRELALGLRALGLNKGDIVCILSETRAEFYLVDLGIMGAGGVAAALYTAYPMSDLVGNIEAARPRFLFIENPKSLADLTEAAEARGTTLPEHIILITGEQTGILSLEDVQQMGRKLVERDPSAAARMQEEVSAEDAAILYTTSGATGEPKMGLTSHAAVLANIDMGPVVLPIGPQDSTVVFLPSAHVAQRIVLELLPMRMGMPVWFSESLARLPSELKAIRPTVFLAPPRVWERMYATIASELKKRPAIARKLFHGALGLGFEAARYRQEGKPLPAWMSRTLKVANKLIFSKVRERLGGRLRVAASGAAPLGKGLAEFFSAIGMPLIEGYGLTEAGVICFNPLDRPKAGSIGKVLPGIDVRLTEESELQVRTPCIFKGYYEDEAATRSVLGEDGWFSTGDIAEVDSDGYWYITGRKKELIVSSNGKKIYPARIEGLFKMEPVVNQVVLIGDKKPYMTAILTLNLTHAKSLKGMTDDKAPVELAKAEPVAKAVQEAVTRVNKQLADFERIRRFKLLDREFSIEQGELTPTMKIRRARVLENHRDLVSELYLGREESE